MDKLGRNYNLFVQTQTGETLKINPPLSLEFDITRKLLGSANTASFRVYNLEKNNRNDLRFNMFNYGQFRSVKLYAGYQNNLSLIFSGNIHEAWSVREGVNFITQIESFDSGLAFAKSPFESTPPAGTDQVDIIKNIVQSMSQNDPNVSLGAISNSYSANISRANPLSGNATDLIDSIANGGFFIDNGKVNCLKDNECLQGAVPIINADSGLLGTPLLEQSILNFDIIFDPRLVIGQLIQLQSSSDNTFNGFYKITAVKHRGMISESVCGDAVTSIGCLTKVGQFKVVSAA